MGKEIIEQDQLIQKSILKFLVVAQTNAKCFNFYVCTNVCKLLKGAPDKISGSKTGLVSGHWFFNSFYLIQQMELFETNIVYF